MNSAGDYFLFSVSFLLISIPVSAVDICRKKIPNRAILAGTVLLMFEKIFIFDSGFIYTAAEMILGFLLFFGIRLSAKGRLGMGDVKFAALMGIFVGFPGWFVAVGSASFLGLLFAATGLLSGRINKNTKIPFAPFLTAGSIVAYFVNYNFLLKIQVWV